MSRRKDRRRAQRRNKDAKTKAPATAPAPATVRDHYAVLDIESNSSGAQIERAYEKGLALVRGETTGGYLMLDEDSAKNAEADIEFAYAVLRDHDKRIALHKALGLSPPPHETPSSSSKKAPSGLRFLKPVDKSGLAPPKGTSGKNFAAPGEDEAGHELPPQSSPPTGSKKNPSLIKIAAPVDSAPPSSSPTRPPEPEIDVNPTLITQPRSARPQANPEHPPEHTANQVAGNAAESNVTETQAEKKTENDAAGEADTPPTSQGPLDGVEINGALVQKLREAKGLSIEDIAKKTHIQKRFLKAIEEEDLENLPSRVYLRGFLTQMARVLSVPKKGLADGYLATLDRLGFS